MSSVVLHLPPDAEQRLREQAARGGQSLEAYLQGIAVREANADGPGQRSNGPKPTPSAGPPLEGRFAGLGVSVSAEVIDEARRELGASFPRELP